MFIIVVGLGMQELYKKEIIEKLNGFIIIFTTLVVPQRPKTILLEQVRRRRNRALELGAVLDRLYCPISGQVEALCQRQRYLFSNKW